MNAVEQLKKFKSDLNNLVDNAQGSGLPLQNLILELDIKKYRLHAVLLQLELDREARKMQQEIIPC